MPWTKMYRRTTPKMPKEQLRALMDEWKGSGHPEVSEEEVRASFEAGQHWINDIYHAVAHDNPSGLTHLSIKRHDRKPIHDWRDMQRIKTDICGPTREGCELYPAEDRVVDTANQYHVWVLPEGTPFPFGFSYGARMNPGDEATTNVKQRPFCEEQMR